MQGLKEKKNKVSTQTILSLLCCSLFAVLMVTVSACDDGGDYNNNEKSYESSFKYSKDGSTGYVSKIMTHTAGTGFPIVIMADGYTQSEIDNGAYHAAVTKAVTALLSNEPMASLKDYLDIYEVTTASSVSGITTAKRSTAFSTYFTSEDGVEIEGNTEKIENYAWLALNKSDIIYNSLILILVNSSRYAGITMMGVDQKVTDSIPGGLSLAFVPVGCTTSSGKECFTEVLQHEAVGHGIGKLCDEYCSEYAAPTETEIEKYKNMQKIGCYLNSKFDTETENDRIVGKYTIRQNGIATSYVMRGHSFKPGELGYLFASDAGYAGEDLMWNQGGALYLTLGSELYDGSEIRYRGCYTIEKNFYRPSWGSIMNDVLDSSNGKQFNALSRYVIYARVMKVAQGSPGNIHSEELMRRFMQFDKLYGNSSSASAKGIGQSTTSSGTSETLPRLPEPRIIPAPSFY